MAPTWKNRREKKSFREPSSSFNAKRYHEGKRTMMNEAIIHLPVMDNNGHSLAYEIAIAEGRILGAFGGFTVTEANGAWQSPQGKIYREPMKVYRIAGDWSKDSEALLSLAAHFAERMDQECIYVVLPSGVHFVEPEAIAA